MRRSLEAPGVGNYNSHQPISKKGSKWGLSKRKIIADDDLKFPPVGTYNPNPVAFELF